MLGLRKLAQSLGLLIAASTLAISASDEIAICATRPTCRPSLRLQLVLYQLLRADSSKDIATKSFKH